jgi:hypothetical protein
MDQPPQKSDDALSLKDDVAIDVQNLEYEWVRQPSLYMKWSHVLGEAIDEKDRLETDLDRLKRALDRRTAELSLLAKRDPSIIGMGDGQKATVEVITAWIKSDGQVIQIEDTIESVKTEVNQARRRVTVFQSAQVALIHKKKSLEMLTEMILSGYYSEPSVSKDAVKKISEKARQEFQLSHTEAIARSVRRRRSDAEEVVESLV